MSRQTAANFGGARVGVLESRLAAETAAMVRRLGGDPVSAPSLAELDVDADQAVTALVTRLVTACEPVVVFLTGVAVTRLFVIADRLGCEATLREGLAGAAVVARGPKPAGALARRGVSPAHSVPEPFTTTDVVATLQVMPVESREVTIVHYGERSEPITSHLEARGAVVHELMLYEWRLPADIEPLSRAVDALIAGEIPVLAFTSQVQVRHLLEVAGSARHTALLAALNNTVLVGAVGPTCAAACTAAGIHAVLSPEHPKLAPLLQLLALGHSARGLRPSDSASTVAKEYV